MLRSRFECGRNRTILLCSSITRRTKISYLFVENMHYLEKTNKKFVQKGGSEATNDSVLSWRWRFAEHLEDIALKLKFHLCSKTKPLLGSKLWAVLKSMSEREIMPIQEEEERASGRPAPKAKQILKQVSTFNPNFIPMKDRKWIDIEVQRSKDQSWYQMSKFVALFTSTQRRWSGRTCRSSWW